LRWTILCDWALRRVLECLHGWGIADQFWAIRVKNGVAIDVADRAVLTSRTRHRTRDNCGITFSCGVNFTQISGSVSFAFPVDRQDWSAVVAIELIMRRERLRRLSAEETPFGAVGAGALRHGTIVVMWRAARFPPPKECR